MKIPSRLKAILEQDGQLAANVMHVVNPFDDILKHNDLYFFKEYTDHGIKHIEDTLQYVENLIAEDTFSVLTPEEIGIMIIAVVLHDIGMHTNTDMFKNMLDGKYDDVQGLFAKEKTWQTLWDEYVYDSRYWSAEKKVNVFGEGEDNHSIKTPNLENPQLLNDYDRKFIGEFIRIHHCRIAYEVAQSGYKGRETLPFNSNRAIPEEMMTIAGIVARSHGMDVRDTFDYLEGQFGDSTTPLGCHAVYLMVLLRLADYLQIDNSRTNKTVLSIGTIGSPYSRQEHQTHLAIKNLQFQVVDKEKILIHAMPKDAKTYIKIEWLTEDIQKEFDRSWAILGEVYPENKFKLRYRRITTNIKNEKYKKKLTYIPKQFCYRFNSELAKLLIAPLYGDNPSLGVRELVQNAVDACRECMNHVKAGEEKPHVTVELDTEKQLFTITDTGKGMTLHEIEHYFLTIGSSYNGDVNWQKKRDAEHIYRTGRFGIGVLAAYLLGPEIVVETRSRSGESGYRFKASLQDKFIQIDKVPNVAFGTKIEIKCNDSCVTKLSDEVEKLKDKFDFMRRFDYRRWFDWYIDENPKVEYYCDGYKIPLPYLPLYGYKPLQHQSDKFGTILWKPERFFTYNDTCLYCNGFFVTNSSNKNMFSLTGLDNYYPFKIPALQIADTYNTLPLNLQRSNIEREVIYDFETELATATLTDLICQLMAIDVRVPNRISNYYFTKNGFAFINQYTHDKLRGKHIIEIEIAERVVFTDWKPIFDLFPDELFHFSINYVGRVVPTDKEIKFKLSDLFSQKRNFSILLFNDPQKEISDALVAYSQGQGHWYGKHFIYTPQPERKQLFEALIPKVKGVLGVEALSYIIIKDIEQGANIPMFDAVFDKYLNGDPIIPYDTAERANKFQLIHQEYKKEIEEYKKRYNI